MGDWQELGQAVVIGLIFSYLVAKLISIVISFKEDNLKLVREQEIVSETVEAETNAELQENARIERVQEQGMVEVEEKEGLLAGDSLVGEEDDEDDDWEGIESTELDEMFSAATAFVAATAADRMTPKVSNDLQLEMYGLYKIATEGPCTAPQPSALKMTARAKWSAWQKLGAVPPEEAMQRYIMIVSELFPSWAGNSTTKYNDEDNAAAAASSSSAKGPMGPVFSSFVHEEESDINPKLDAIHDCAREGDTDGLLNHIKDGVSVNLRDSEGRSPLHWAVDRGHLDAVKILLSKNANVNAKDDESQSPLHYAVLCEREAIAELLVNHNADLDLKDDDGNSPMDLCGTSWPCMTKRK